jgi:hypothetical protein
MIRSFRDVNVANPVNGDPIRFSELSVPASFGSDTSEKGASWREFLDPAVTRIGDQNIAVGINGNPYG